MEPIESMPGKLDALTQRVGGLERTVSSLEQSMGAWDEKLKENTDLTRQIEQHTRDLVAMGSTLMEMAGTYSNVKTTAKVTTSAVSWTSGIVAKLALIGAAIAGVWHWLGPKIAGALVAVWQLLTGAATK